MCSDCWACHTLQSCDIWPPLFPREVSVPACNNRCWRPQSQVSNPDPSFNANYWLCWLEKWIPQKTQWFSFHVFVLVGKCLFKCCSCIECFRVTSCTLYFTQYLYSRARKCFSWTFSTTTVKLWHQNLQGWFYQFFFTKYYLDSI